MLFGDLCNDERRIKILEFVKLKSKEQVPTFYIIAGPNGAGKTTLAGELLKEIGVIEFVNADNIAKGISPFNTSGVEFQAGRLMLQRINQLVSQNETFAIETTLSSKT